MWRTRDTGAENSHVENGLKGYVPCTTQTTGDCHVGRNKSPSLSLWKTSFAMNFVEELRDDFLICNICFEEYRDPKQLPCLHTFCRGCLFKYITGKIAETGTDWFPCPFCRKPIQPELRGEVTLSFLWFFLGNRISAMGRFCENWRNYILERFSDRELNNNSLLHS